MVVFKGAIVRGVDSVSSGVGQAGMSKRRSLGKLITTAFW
jgi:hypothetical protein